MTAPDVFALGGRPEEAQRIDFAQVAREWGDMWARWRRGGLTEDEQEEIIEEMYDLVDAINEAEPESVLDCAVKLSVVALHKGIDEFRKGDFESSMRQVIDFLAGEIAGGAA